MAITAVLTILASWIAVLLCIPLSYNIRLYLGDPAHITGTVHWLGRVFCYTWEYTYGNRPSASLSIMGKRRRSAPDTPPAIIDKAAQQVEEDGSLENAVTYEDLKNTEVPPFPWKRYVLNLPFTAACFRWIVQILSHSRPCVLTASGVIGLKTPHETGMLAGALYAAVPEAVGSLRFSYTKEEYDCTIRGAGRLYPAVFLIYSAAFITSRPVRRLLIRWHTAKRGAHHGS